MCKCHVQQDLECRWDGISPENVEIALLGFVNNLFFLVCYYASSFIYPTVIWCFHSLSFSLEGVSSLRTLILNVICKVFFSSKQKENNLETCPLALRTAHDGYNTVKNQIIGQNSCRLGLEEEGNGGLMKGEIWSNWNPTLITNSCWFFFFYSRSVSTKHCVC